MADPKVQVLNRLVLSKEFIGKDKTLKAAVDDYAKKTAAFGKMLAEVKAASAALKTVVEGKVKDKIDLDAGTEWRAVEGSEEGTIIVEVIKKNKIEGSRSRVPTASL